MNDSMDFPNAWRKFLQEYSFKDKEQIYTNGSELIPVFRVEQMVEHYLVEKQTCEYWYQGYYKLLGELANYKWISVKDRMPKSGDTVLVLWDDRYLYNGNEIHNRRIQTAICCNEDFDTKCFVADDTYYTEVINVTHWMPLPQPPEKE